jgi:hypothetical protein
MSAYTLNEFLTIESLRSCLLRISPPSFWKEKEEKPDTLMPNSCGVCGASFVDHGRLACSDDVCLYGERNKQGQVIEDILQRIESEAELVNTVQEPQVAETKPRAPRAPKEADIHWPAMRVKNFIKEMNKSKPTKPRMNHVEGLEYLAHKGKLTVEELLKTSPPAYLDRLGLDAHSKSLFYYGNTTRY